MAEFDGIRAKLYKEALSEFPDARRRDLELMQKYLEPKSGEVILEIGAGNGLFSGTIADAILPSGKLYVLDPSLEQLAGISELKRKNIEIINKGSEEINLPNNSIDAIWSFGAVHHIKDKQKAFKEFNRVLKRYSRLVIGDVFQGSSLAKHFDEKVAKYCITGHDVTFLTRESAEKFCLSSGFEKPTFDDFNARWEFNNKEDIGIFLYKIHAMTKTTPENCLRSAEEILGIEENNAKYYINWLMKMIITHKKRF